MVHYGCDDPNFQRMVDALRFSVEPPLEFAELDEMLAPLFKVAYDAGYEDGQEDGPLE